MYGNYQYDRNLALVELYNASHMASVDVPEATLDLIKMFTNNPSKLFPNSTTNVPEMPIPVEQQPINNAASSHYIGGFFIIFMLTAAVMAGLFIKKKLNARATEWFCMN